VNDKEIEINKITFIFSEIQIYNGRKS
jgi:hypothetical protein